ncbi:MAG TPA: nucleotide exchange factor GrpE [Chloroflexota bacterium]
MTDDTAETTQQSNESSGPEDSRFEVKWKKKSETTPQTPPLGPQHVAVESVDDLKRQLEEEKQRTQDLHDRWQRAAADLVNLRRRTEQEREEQEKFAGMLMVQELLPVLDNFQRALTTIPGNLQMLTWIQGVMLIERHFSAILERRGLSAIDATGQQFNAYFHEAISERETDEAAPGNVLQEYQRGYTMHGRVIRPTLVEVAKAPSETPPQAQPQSDEAVETDETKGQEIAEESEAENIGP